MDPYNMAMDLFDVLQEPLPSSSSTSPLTDDVFSLAVSPLMTPDHNDGAMSKTQYKVIYNLPSSGSSSYNPSDARLSLSSTEIAAAKAIAQGSPDLPNPFHATNQAITPFYQVLQPISLFSGAVAATATISQLSPAHQPAVCSSPS